MWGTLLILGVHSCGLRVLGPSGGGESHLHGEVDDPLDSHERAQLRHLHAAVSGRIGLRLIQTAAHSAPYLSLRLRAAHRPINRRKTQRKPIENGIQGERRDPGRAAGWRGRCTEVGERAFLRVKSAEGLFTLIFSATPVVSRSAIHI